MPQTRNVILNYDPENASVPFGPTPRQVAVGPGDTILFQIGDSTRASHQNCKLRITLHKGDHFSHPAPQASAKQPGQQDLAVKVTAGSAAELAAAASNHIITGYKCELLDANGSPIAGLVSDGSDGGEIVPDSGGL